LEDISSPFVGSQEVFMGIVQWVGETLQSSETLQSRGGKRGHHSIDTQTVCAGGNMTVKLAAAP